MDPWAGVEELIVTGTGSGNLLSDIAESNSVTAFDADDLAALGAGNISDIASFTPNLEIVTAGATSPTFFIRGIGLNDFNANAAGAVAIYTDDVPLNSPALQLGSLFDIEGANVIRGPQGSGSFRNASAGAIKVYSKRPSGDVTGFLKVEGGNFDAVDVEGAIDVPIVDILTTRISFRYQDRDGTLRNRCSGAPAFADRVPFEPPIPNGTDPRVSFCGERVLPNLVSTVDEDQPKWINSRSNWAARGVFLFEPDIFEEVGTSFRFVARGGVVNQPSTLGQSIGTNGNTGFRDLDPGASDLVGRLGGTDSFGYRDLDISNAAQATILSLRNSTCPRNPVTGALQCSRAQRLATRDLGNRLVSGDLARDLDDDPFAGAYSHTGGTTNSTWGLSLKSTFDFGDAFTLTSISGFDKWQRRVDTDLDFSPNTLFETQTTDRGFQIYQELRAESDIEMGGEGIFEGLFSWEAGAFVLHEDLDVFVRLNFGQGTGLNGAPFAREYTQTVTTLAGYVNGSWELSEAFTLDAGLRYNWERREIDYLLRVVGPPQFQKSEIVGEEPTGSVRLTYEPTEELSFYAKYTKGWKSGTFNATGSARLGVTDASPEEISAFEVGTNIGLFEDAIQIYASLFHYNYRNYQLFTSQSAFQAPPEFVILNAEEVELFGSEVEATFTPPWWDGGFFDVKFAWLEGEFIDFVQIQLGQNGDIINPQVILREIDNSGNRLLNAPQFSVTLSLQQSVPIADYGSLTARWDGTWKSATFFDATQGRGIPNQDNIQFLPTDTIGQGAYWLHNFRLSYLTPDGNIEIAGWVRNMTNEVFKTFSADLSTFQRTTLNFVGDPRTFGATATIRF